MATEADIVQIVEALPETTVSPSAFEVGGKGFAWFYQEKIEGQKGRVERRDVLAVRVASEDEKQLLIAADPGKFFNVPHYNGYPAVLIHLSAIDVGELEELLVDAWRIKAPRKLVAIHDAENASPPDN